MFTIAVPTTAGTAAEVTINYVITDPERSASSCASTPTTPPRSPSSTRHDGFHARRPDRFHRHGRLTHAIEGYTTKGAWGSPTCSTLRH
ncbi:MAG: iron-containing alcohol dehydrogenase [Collinsella sp.]